MRREAAIRRLSPPDSRPESPRLASPLASLRSEPSCLNSPRLYAIADGDCLGLDHVVDAVKAMAESGVLWIQLRLKNAVDNRRFDIASQCAESLRGSESLLWIDDRTDIAALLDGAAVHVGQKDLPPSAARQIIGEGRRIGQSCHDAEQVSRADRDPEVDVVAIGPIFNTTSKQSPGPALGLRGVSEARRCTSKPLVAIGGIDADNARSVLSRGADTVAMIGAVCRGDVAVNCRQLMALLQEESS